MVISTVRGSELGAAATQAAEVTRANAKGTKCFVAEDWDKATEMLWRAPQYKSLTMDCVVKLEEAVRVKESEEY